MQYVKVCIRLPPHALGREECVYSGEYLRQNCEWRSVQTMSNADFIVSGSTHQTDRRFSDVSRGRQSTFTSLSTLLRANSYHVSQWTADIVDEILIEGDAMYVLIQKHSLSLTYLPDQVHWPTMTADRAKTNPLPTASTLCV